MTIKTIPLIFIHTGNQEYLKYTITQAEKYNECVYLIGDDSNRNFCKKWVDSKEYLEEEYFEFEKTYKHMSSNSKEFELGCFARYYLAYSFAQKNNLETFMFLDSDLMVYKNFSELNWEGFDAALSIQYSQEPYIWTVSVHCSYWTIKTMRSFLDFLMKAYENNIDDLNKKWEYHLKNNIPGGICDMTLVYLWYKSHSELHFYNTTQISKGTVFDHFLHQTEGYKNGEFRVNNFLEMKKLKFVDGIPYTMHNDGDWIQTYTIHAQGKRKMYLRELSECRSAKVYYYLVKVKRECLAAKYRMFKILSIVFGYDIKPT